MADPWESAPLVNTDPWESAPLVVATTPRTPKTFAQALGRGVIQGGTLGFGDELGGAVQGGLQGLSNLLPSGALNWAGIENRYGDTPVTETYKAARNYDRAENKAAEKDQGGAYLGGQLIGGLVTAPAFPAGAGLGATIATGAGLGAAQGLGNSESDSAMGDAGNALLGGALGGAVSGLGYGVGKLAGKISGAAGRKAAGIQQKVADEGLSVAGGETATARSGAGNAATAAYKNPANIDAAIKAGAMTLEDLTPEQQALYRGLLKERAQKAAEEMAADAARKTSKAAEYAEAIATEPQRAAKIAADKLSAGEFKRQLGARALRYGLPAAGGAAYNALTGDSSPMGLLKGAGLGGLAGAGMRPMMRSMLRLGKQPVVQNALWSILQGSPQLGQALAPAAESMLATGAAQLRPQGASLLEALANLRQKKQEEEMMAGQP